MNKTTKAQENPKYYVYELVDPRNNKPFYIGKGSGDRIDYHEKAARLGGCNAEKLAKITSIINDGQNIGKNIIKRFTDEQKAYKFEANLINQTPNLTNIVKNESKVRAKTISLFDIMSKVVNREIGEHEAGNILLYFYDRTVNKDLKALIVAHLKLSIKANWLPIKTEAANA